jgi:hypothetical protein
VPSRKPAAAATLARLPFLLPGGVALLLGIDAGLQLLGVPAVPVSQRLPDSHGPLLVLGFVGTLIALERAVALRRRGGFAAPALLGVGGLLLVVTPVPLRVGQALLVAGSAAMALLYAWLWRRNRDDAVVVQALGAVMATGGAVLWLGSVPVSRLLPWLAAFVVLTIAGERLELARLELLGTAAPARLVAVSVATVLATTTSLLWPQWGVPALGLSLLALVGWLAAHDVTRRTIRSSGLPRFVAACLVAGYAWLAVAGAVWLLHGPTTEGPAYDATVHAVFLGFTMSMIMAHAPVILPAVLRVRLPYHPVMYVPAALLHLSLLLRLAVGDARGLELPRQVGGALNGLALVLFVAVVVWSALRARRSRPTSPPAIVGDQQPAAAAPEAAPAPGLADVRR